MKLKLPNPYRIFYALPLVISLLVLLSVMLFWWQFESFQKAYFAETEAELEFQCQMLAHFFKEEGFETLEEFCRRNSENPWRVTVLDTAGNVLVDSEKSGSLENHLSRPEIQELLQSNHSGTDIHFSQTLNEWRFYYAELLKVHEKQYILRLSIPMNPISTLFKRVVWSILFAVLAGAGLVTILTFFIVFRLRLPLSKIQESAVRIAAGDHSQRVFVPKRGVTRPLALAVAQMARQLRQQIGDLTVLESFRSDFIANVSHELKTPLTVILSSAEMLEDGAKDIPEKRDRCLKMLTHQTRRLQYLIQDILSLSALEQKQKEGKKGRETTNFTDIPASSLLRNVLENCMESASKANILLEIKPAEGTDLQSPLLPTIPIHPSPAQPHHSLANSAVPAHSQTQTQTQNQNQNLSETQTATPFLTSSSCLNGHSEEVSRSEVPLPSESSRILIQGDIHLLEQALTNLVVNAIRYSESPQIHLSAKVEDGNAILSVRDFGIGISEENAPRIFERFYRVHKERSRELGGTGLGLAIVKHIAQLHGGQVQLHSKEGQGCEFRLILPLKNEEI